MSAVAQIVRSTLGLLRRSAARRDARAVAGVVGLLYPVGYLVALGHLSLGGTGVDLVVVADPLSRAVEARAPYSYEPVARVVVGPVVWLVAPVNVGLAALLGVLVAANAAVVVVSARAPEACGARARTGPFAGVFALVGGATCCGPALFFLVGVQATSALVAAFSVLVPLSVALLVGSLLLAGR